MRKRLLTIVAVAGLAGVAWADHPERQQMEEVKAAAHQLERATHHVRENAGHHGGRALNTLENRAKHFHRQAERYRNDPRHTEQDFQAVADAYYLALDELHHMDRHVRDDFRDVDAHMHTLMDYYGGRDYWDGLGGVSAGDGRRHR